MNSRTTRPRMLVTGAAGMVGSYVGQAFPDYDLILTDAAEGFHTLDVRDPSSVMKTIEVERPDVVLHLAAATDVDRCEREPDWAFHSNAIATQNVALACQRHHVTLVYVSSAAVFSGDKLEPYTEYDAPRPANVYGESKLAGERAVETLLQQFYVVRAGWMIGGGEKDKKFLGKIAGLLLTGVPLKIVHDKIGSPTYAQDLLIGINRLLATGYYGTYHMSNAGACSRYDIALAIRDVLELPGVPIEPVSSAYFPLSAPRARSEAMRNLKLELLGLPPLRPWREALEQYVSAELAPLLRQERR